LGDISWFRYQYYELILFGDPELRLRVTKDETAFCVYTCGDQDGAGVNVDMVDFGLFASCWGEDLSDSSTDPNCICANLVEFDKHIIDLLDLSVLAELFLSSSEFYPPNNCSTSITDPYAPSPDPMSFATAPHAVSSDTIIMTATNAKDISGIEYYFTNTAGGGHDSGWQDSTFYADTSLTPGTLYTYTVTARDKSINQNTTDASIAESATTPEAPSVVTSKSVYAVNETIVVHFANAAGNATDWVGLFRPTTPSTNYDEIQWMYTDGTQSGTAGIYDGTLYFNGLAAGSYEARLHFNDGYTVEASCDITIE
jgi:hypothetical protein